MFLVLLLLTVAQRTKTVEATQDASSQPKPINLPAKPLTAAQKRQRGNIARFLAFVFGKYEAEALDLLQNASCGENINLDPKLITHNWVKDEKYFLSSNVGVFQLNTSWDEVKNTPKQSLLNYKDNIRLAWVIFVNDGYSFDRWTCGTVVNPQ